MQVLGTQDLLRPLPHWGHHAQALGQTMVYSRADETV